jgi:hypothetical protein
VVEIYMDVRCSVTVVLARRRARTLANADRWFGCCRSQFLGTRTDGGAGQKDLRSDHKLFRD